MWTCAISLILKPPEVPHGHLSKDQLPALYTGLLLISFPHCSHELRKLLSFSKNDPHTSTAWYVLLLLLHMVSNYILSKPHSNASLPRPRQAKLMTCFPGSLCTRSVWQRLPPSILLTCLLLPSCHWNLLSGTPQDQDLSLLIFHAPQILWGSCGVSLSSQIFPSSKLGAFTATLMDCGECVYYKVWENQSSVYSTNIYWMWDTQMSKTRPLLLESSRSGRENKLTNRRSCNMLQKPSDTVTPGHSGDRGMGEDQQCSKRGALRVDRAPGGIFWAWRHPTWVSENVRERGQNRMGGKTGKDIPINYIKFLSDTHIQIESWYKT